MTECTVISTSDRMKNEYDAVIPTSDQMTDENGAVIPTSNQLTGNICCSDLYK
jgi:hypothetical protein